MTIKATTGTAKRAAVQSFEVALNDAMAGMGEYRKLLLLRKLNASMGELKAKAKGPNQPKP